jgi:hypothetical protein
MPNSAAHQIQQHAKFSNTPNSVARQIQQHTKFSGTPNYHTKQHNKNTSTLPTLLLTTDLLPALCSSLKYLTVNAAPSGAPTV